VDDQLLAGLAVESGALATWTDRRVWLSVDSGGT